MTQTMRFDGNLVYYLNKTTFTIEFSKKILSWQAADNYNMTKICWKGYDTL